MAKIDTLISKTKSEHLSELTETQRALESLMIKVSKLQQKSASRDALLTETAKLAILKDKLIFHKACVLLCDYFYEQLNTAGTNE